MLMLHNGKLLVRGGNLATDARCCCGAACVEVSEVVALGSKRVLFSFPAERTIVSADPGVFVVNGATGTVVSISGNNITIEFAADVLSGDPWTIADGSQIQFDNGSVACDNQNGSVL